MKPKYPDIPFTNTNEVLLLLGVTIDQVHRGKMDPKVGQCIGNLASMAMKAMVQGDIEKRLEQLEAVVHINTGGPQSTGSLFNKPLGEPDLLFENLSGGDP